MAIFIAMDYYCSQQPTRPNLTLDKNVATGGTENACVNICLTHPMVWMHDVGSRRVSVCV